MKKYLLKSQISLIAFFLFVSCSSSRIVHLNSVNRYAPINPDEVIIYVDEKDIPAQYEKLAIITTNYVSGADKSKWRNVRNKCSKIGANGIISKMELRASSGARVAAAIFGTVASDKAEFLAIRVLELQKEGQIENSSTTNNISLKKSFPNNSNKSILQQKLDKQSRYTIGTKVLFELYSKIYSGIITSTNGNYMRVEYTDKSGKVRTISRYYDKLEIAK